MSYANKPLVDCFKKTNLVTFSNQNKIELICSDDPINILVRLNFNLLAQKKRLTELIVFSASLGEQKNPYETTAYAYNENGSLTLSTTV